MLKPSGFYVRIGVIKGEDQLDTYTFTLAVSLSMIDATESCSDGYFIERYRAQIE